MEKFDKLPDENDDLTQYNDHDEIVELGLEPDHFAEDFDDHYDESGDEDSAELERRRLRYAELKKDDKIFNNTYNLGYENPMDQDDPDDSLRGTREIKVDSSSPNFFLYDPEKYSEYIYSQIIQKEIFAYIADNEEINQLLGPEPEKKKFVKAEINQIFTNLCTNLISRNNRNYFITPIYVLDAISVTVSTDYKKLFDMLSYENKEILLLELNSKYGFLDKIAKSNKMF